MTIAWNVGHVPVKLSRGLIQRLLSQRPADCPERLNHGSMGCQMKKTNPCDDVTMLLDSMNIQLLCLALARTRCSLEDRRRHNEAFPLDLFAKSGHRGLTRRIADCCLRFSQCSKLGQRHFTGSQSESKHRSTPTMPGSWTARPALWRVHAGVHSLLDPKTWKASG